MPDDVVFGAITPRAVYSYSRRGLEYTFNGVAESRDQHRAIEEMCWGAESETARLHIGGTRLYAVDLTVSQRYVIYIQFQFSRQDPKNGWYLIRRFRSFANQSARGMNWPFGITCTFLGTTGTLKEGFKLFSPHVERNDWGI